MMFRRLLLVCVLLAVCFSETRAFYKLPDAEPLRGNAVVASCAPGVPSQTWHLSLSGDTLKESGPIASPNGGCLDVESYDKTDGANVQVYTCQTDGRSNQQWRFQSGTVTSVLSGKCLESQGFVAGSNVVTSACQSNARHQQWKYDNATGALQSAMDGSLCLANRGKLQLDQNRAHPIIIGHRGTSTGAPENTVAAFKYAMSVGADGFETDLWLSKDGEVVLCHDGTLDRTTNCTGAIEDYTVAELRYCDACYKFDPTMHCPVPTLDEAMEVAMDTGARVVLDLKRDGLAEATALVVRAHKAEDNVLASCRTEQQVIDFGLALNTTVRHRLESQPTVHDAAFFEGEILEGVRGYSISASSMTPDFVRAAHEHFMGVFFWTIDGEKDIINALYNGADGMISDSAAFVIQVVANWRAAIYNDTHPSGQAPMPALADVAATKFAQTHNGHDSDIEDTLLCAKLSALLSQNILSSEESFRLRRSIRCP